MSSDMRGLIVSQSPPAVRACQQCCIRSVSTRVSAPFCKRGFPRSAPALKALQELCWNCGTRTGHVIGCLIGHDRDREVLVCLTLSPSVPKHATFSVGLVSYSMDLKLVSSSILILFLYYCLLNPPQYCFLINSTYLLLNIIV